MKLTNGARTPPRGGWGLTRKGHEVAFLKRQKSSESWFASALIRNCIDYITMYYWMRITETKDAVEEKSQ